MYKIRKGVWETSSSGASALAMVSGSIHVAAPKLDKPFRCIRGEYFTNSSSIAHIYLSGWMDKMAYLAEDSPLWHNMFKHATGQDFEMWVVVVVNDQIKSELTANQILFEEFPAQSSSVTVEFHGEPLKEVYPVYREPEWGYICGYNIDYLIDDCFGNGIALIKYKDLNKALKLTKAKEPIRFHETDAWGLSDIFGESEPDEAVLEEIIFNPGFAINIGGEEFINDTRSIPAIGSPEDKQPLRRRGYEQLCGYYRNGTEKLLIGIEGTRIRIFDDNSVPEYPESIDLKITDCCPHGCEFCYESCTPDGKHGTIHKCLENLPEFVELAIGGGNILANPEYERYLGLTGYCNATLHGKDFAALFEGQHNVDFLHDHFFRMPLLKCRAWGVSVNSENDSKTVKAIYDNHFPDSVIGNDEAYYEEWNLTDMNEEYLHDKSVDTVIHVINGIITHEALKHLYDMNQKLLVLGYKTKGRGIEYADNPSVAKNQKWLYDNIQEVASHFKGVAFDTLALKQLDMKRFLTQEQWDTTFMGEDGLHSMYIDLVTQTYGISSTDNRRWPLTDDIRQMFRHVRETVMAERNTAALMEK